MSSDKTIAKSSHIIYQLDEKKFIQYELSYHSCNFYDIKLDFNDYMINTIFDTASNKALFQIKLIASNNVFFPLFMSQIKHHCCWMSKWWKPPQMGLQKILEI